MEGNFQRILGYRGRPQSTILARRRKKRSTIQEKVGTKGIDMAINMIPEERVYKVI